MNGFDIDEFGIARAELAQFSAYRSGIAFLVEEILPLGIGRPPAVAPVIPAGDPRIDSGSKRNAVHICEMQVNTLKYSKRGPSFQIVADRGAARGLDQALERQ
jgi:hypothetical protein